MGLLECASGAAVWRGYDYYKEKKIKTLEEIGDNIYSATVTGSSNERYSVELHVGHPRKSKCNCPHADGKRVICKHIVAAYFTAFPEEAEKFYTEAMAYQEEEEKHKKAKEEWNKWWNNLSDDEKLSWSMGYGRGSGNWTGD